MSERECVGYSHLGGSCIEITPDGNRYETTLVYFWFQPDPFDRRPIGEISWAEGKSKDDRDGALRYLDQWLGELKKATDTAPDEGIRREHTCAYLASCLDYPSDAHKRAGVVNEIKLTVARAEPDAFDQREPGVMSWPEDAPDDHREQRLELIANWIECLRHLNEDGQ